MNTRARAILDRINTRTAAIQTYIKEISRMTDANRADMDEVYRVLGQPQVVDFIKEKRIKVEEFVNSMTNHHDRYRVRIYTDNTAECTCPHFQNRLARYGGECKHITRVRNRNQVW